MKLRKKMIINWHYNFVELKVIRIEKNGDINGIF
jgi:hypothetical protein